MKKIDVKTQKPYSIFIENHILQKNILKNTIELLNKRPVVIMDEKLKSFCTLNIEAEFIFFPLTENNKTRETKQQLEDILLSKQYGRDTCLIAVGGGVTLDIVGFLASTYCRGIPVIYIPTTLLAMVDACIGGKTAVNTSFGKNLIGTFTQPHAVFIDPTTLNTLPDDEFYSGLSEIIKHAVIADKSLFEFLEKNEGTIKNRDSKILCEIIYHNCLIKKLIIEQDEIERSLRQLLNFGHTIGHAIEAIENYRIKHGEAIAIGMLVESYISMKLNLLSENDFIRLEKLLQTYQLPLKTRAFSNKKAFLNQLELDKKNKNKIPYFVLLNRIGKPYVLNNQYSTQVSINILQEAIEWANSYSVCGLLDVSCEAP